MLDLEIRKKIEQYLKFETEEIFTNEIRQMLEEKNYEELSDRFFQNLEFGTGGLRGKVGGGFNRMNTLVVRQATQGLANYLIKQKGLAGLKAVIAYDSRRFSKLFALKTALVLAANNIKTYLFKELTPTPLLSFMLRYLGCNTGIVITASHNPPQYNGYKVFWEDGAQIVEPHDINIIKAILEVGERINDITETEARKNGLLQDIIEEEEAYFKMIANYFKLDKSFLANAGKDFNVLYTPLHGTGLKPVTKLFQQLGIPYSLVEKQAQPDENFTYAPIPNPESPVAFQLAQEELKIKPAEIVIATDPDADRIGLMCKQGIQYKLLNGNEVGFLFLYYLLNTRLNTLPPNAKPYIIKTIVTSDIQRRIAADYNVICFDTLTGFKNIGALIKKLENEKPDYYFIFANEESCGYLLEKEVRDKDGVSAAALAAEVALDCRKKKITISELIRQIYEKYGLFMETQLSKNYEGEVGMKLIKSIMEQLRDKPQEIFKKARVVLSKDYLKGEVKNYLNGNMQKDSELPKSDVLQYYFEDGTVITARPSGTEPKIKFYFSLHLDPPFNYNEAEKILKERTTFYQDEIQNYLKEKSL